MPETVKRCKPRILPVRFLYWNHLANAETLRTAGYRVKCECDAVFVTRETWAEARSDVRDHLAGLLHS